MLASAIPSTRQHQLLSCATKSPYQRPLTVSLLSLSSPCCLTSYRCLHTCVYTYKRTHARTNTRIHTGNQARAPVYVMWRACCGCYGLASSSNCSSSSACLTKVGQRPCVPFWLKACVAVCPGKPAGSSTPHAHMQGAIMGSSSSSSSSNCRHH